MNLSPIVSKTIPEFVNDDYPLFVQFLKTYYKWIDNTQINSIENVVDIDNTLESFIQYFRKETLLPPIPQKGFVLLTYQSVPIGWIKNMGNRCNNLYPSEWRIRMRILLSNPVDVTSNERE